MAMTSARRRTGAGEPSRNEPHTDNDGDSRRKKVRAQPRALLAVIVFAAALFILPLVPAAIAADKAGLPAEIAAKVEAAEAGDTEAMVELGGIYGQGAGVERDLDEAVRWYERAAAADNLIALFSLGLTYDERRAAGDLEKAAKAYQRGYDIVEKAYGADHKFAGVFLSGLGAVHGELGRYDEALDVYDRARDIFTATADADALNVVANDSAIIYAKLGRHAEAAAAFEQVVLYHEINDGPGSLAVAETVLNLARSQKILRDFDKALENYVRAFTIFETTEPTPHRLLGDLFASVADLYWRRGGDDAYQDATTAYFNAIQHYKAIFGDDHETIATVYYRIGDINFDLGRYPEAAGNYEGGLKSFEKIYGPENIRLVPALSLTAGARLEAGEVDLALSGFRRATRIAIADFNRNGDRTTGTAALNFDSVRNNEDAFRGLVVAAAEKAANNADNDTIEETFIAAQWSSRTSASAALAQMSARFGAGDTRLAELVRERQDRIIAWNEADARLVAARNSGPDDRDADIEQAFASERSAIDARIAEIDTELAAAYPAFTELSRPQPLTIDESPALLRPGEAMISFLVANTRTFAWLVTKTDAKWITIDKDADEIAGMVGELRAGLDRYGAGVRGAEPLTAGGQGLRFDLHLANELHHLLFGGFETELRDIEHLIIVPDGALQSLPPSVLVASRPQARFGTYAELVETDWLLRRHALTVLPAVTSLRALRSLAGAGTTAREPFIGFGNPVLDGPAVSADKQAGSGKAAVTLAGLFRGAIADVDQVRSLPPLPETQYELQSIAGLLGAGPEQVYLGARANEAALKHMSLDSSRIIAFATHGLLAGDISGLAEPALVLTPPATPSEENDGLLTASEIAQLNLNADWVLLSACNTASGDGTPGAEGLSGLARAFFYAGTRSILVSHWPVQSDAAVELTTGAFAARKADEGIGRAEALRRSIMAFIDDPAHPENAHPERWAPFVLVGEGLL